MENNSEKRLKFDWNLCVFANCKMPAAGQGKLLHGVPLCCKHLDEDSQQFNEMYSDVKSKSTDFLVKLSGLLRENSEHLFELINDRADASDLLDAISDRLQECRKKILGRMDVQINGTEDRLAELNAFKSLEAGASEAETSNDLAWSLQLRTELHKTLETVHFKKYKVEPKDDTVELLQLLQHDLNLLVAEVEAGTCRQLKSRLLTSAALKSTFSFADQQTKAIHVTFCNETKGFFYSVNGVSNAPTEGCSELPDTCVILVHLIDSGALEFLFLNADLNLIAQSLKQTEDNKLIAVTCVSHLQRIFILGNFLTVADLTGTCIQRITGAPEITEAVDMTHDMEKLYVLVEHNIIILSLSTFEVHGVLHLEEVAEDLRGICVSGRRKLWLVSPSSMYRRGIHSDKCKKIFNCKGIALQSMVEIGCGQFAVSDSSGMISVFGSDGQELDSIIRVGKSACQCVFNTRIRSCFNQARTSCQLIAVHGCEHGTLINRYTLY